MHPRAQQARTSFPAMLSFLAMLVIPVSTTFAGSGERVAFTCSSNFLSIIQSNDVLELQGVDIQVADDGNKYLLALGTAAVRAGISNQPSLLNVRKIAEVKAKQAASEFLKSDLRTKTTLTQTREITTTAEAKGTNAAAVLQRKREELIIQRSQVVLSGATIVATWFNSERTVFYVVVATLAKPQTISN
jgi:hypothetical protein